ncbi:PAS domain S-box protein [Undibacterium sp. Di24W]|uniref:PAS domain S-box protein n=1 Tax=Undibacterium sp. Di24W TaxID=3413033 RepID=UPI003BF0A063
MKIMNWQSLSTRLMLTSMLIIVSSIWGVAVYVSNIVQADMLHSLEAQQFSTLTVLAAQMDDAIKFRAQSIEKVAAAITADMLHDPRKMQAYLDSSVVLDVIFNAGAFITTIDGVVNASVPTSLKRIGVSYADRDYFLAAMEGKSSISKPIMGKVLGTPVFVMATPIRDVEGKVIGVLGGVTNLAQSSFLDPISHHKYGKSGDYALITPLHKLVITSTDQRLIMRAADNRHPLFLRYLDAYEGSGLLVDQFGAEMLSSSKRIPAANWILMAELPTKEAFSSIELMKERTIWAAVLLSFMVTGLVFVIIRHQLKPMLEATSTLARLRVEDSFPDALAETKDDEIGALIGGFNRLLLALRERDASLRVSEENLSITLESIGDAVIATDARGNITRMNKTACRLTAWTLSDAQGQSLSTVFNIINAQTRLPCVNPVQLVMEHGKVVGLANHTALISRDGSEYQISDSAAPILDNKGMIVGVVLVFSDVTAQYQVQEDLQRTGEMLRQTGELAKVGGWQLDLLTKDLRWTPETFRIAEVTPPNEPPLEDGINLFAPEAQPVITDALQQTMTTGEPYDLELPIITANGNHKWVRTQGFAVWHDEKIVKLRGTFQDISERYLADIKLREVEQRFRDLVESTDGIVWEADAKTFAFNSVSKNAERILGFPVSDWLVPGFWVSRVYEEDREYAVNYCAACTGRLENHDFEYRFVARDGNLIWLRDIVKVVAEEGKPKWLRGLMIDITAKKKEQDILRDTLREKTSLLNEVHHRVKNNLQVITSLLRLESGRSNQENTKTVLNEMQGRIRSMALLHETLYRSGIFASADLAHYLKELATQAFRSHINSNGGAVRLELDLHSVHVSMDQATPCGLIVNELISNSLKHAFSGELGGVVKLSLLPQPETKSVCIMVSDDGIGLPSDFAQRRELSLGLQLVDDLVAQIGGVLSIETGHGCKFSINFNCDE